MKRRNVSGRITRSPTAKDDPEELKDFLAFLRDKFSNLRDKLSNAHAVFYPLTRTDSSESEISAMINKIDVSKRSAVHLVGSVGLSSEEEVFRVLAGAR